MKRRKLLIALAVTMLAVSVLCVSTALILSHRNSHKNATAAFEEVKVQIARKDKEAFEAVSSYNVKGLPDEDIKKAVFNFYQNKMNARLLRFDLMKTYASFRVYDITTEQYGERSDFLLIVWADKNKAAIYEIASYENFEERADKLTAFIEQMDADYAKQAQLAQKADSQRILY